MFSKHYAFSFSSSIMTNSALKVSQFTLCLNQMQCNGKIKKWSWIKLKLNVRVKMVMAKTILTLDTPHTHLEKTFVITPNFKKNGTIS